MSRAAKPRRLAEAVIESATPVLSISSALPHWPQIRKKPRCNSPGMAAADEGVHALDAMDQPVLDQEIERAIDGRRRRAEILVAQLVEQRVGADRLVARPHQLEHPLAQRREAQALVGAQLFRGHDRILDAVLMVVTFAGRVAVRGALAGFFTIADLPSECATIIGPLPLRGQRCPNATPIRRPRSTKCSRPSSSMPRAWCRRSPSSTTRAKS